MKRISLIAVICRTKSDAIRFVTFFRAMGLIVYVSSLAQLFWNNGCGLPRADGYDSRVRAMNSGWS
jgi:hypothetical protein